MEIGSKVMNVQHNAIQIIMLRGTDNIPQNIFGYSHIQYECWEYSMDILSISQNIVMDVNYVMNRYAKGFDLEGWHIVSIANSFLYCFIYYTIITITILRLIFNVIRGWTI
jgi:hypothetical protein